jgi:hypothetical protein
MKLAPIAQNIVFHSYTRILLESATSDAAAVQKQLFSLGTELKKDGDDITDDEVQAAMLSALIDANGKLNNIDVSDVNSIKKEIKESRSYINEDAGILHSIELIGTVLGNAALIHIIAEDLHKMGFKNVDERKLKIKLDAITSSIKNVTGYPAKAMEKAFSWIASKLGAEATSQKIAGISGVLVLTISLLALAIYLFPSITSGLLIVVAISGMIGKSTEIVNLVGQLIAHIKEHQAELKNN